MQDPHQSLEQAIAEFDLAFAHAAEYSENLSRFVTDSEAEWYAALLTALVGALVLEYGRLRRGIGEDLGLLAWACRNLVELNVFVKYVLKSHSNAKEFYGHRLVDAVHIGEAMKNLLKVLAPEVCDGEDAEILAGFYNQKQKENVTTSRYLNVGDMAKSISDKKAAEYEAFNRICSKFVHPTACSVLSARRKDPKVFYEALYKWGAIAGIVAYADLKKRLDELGILAE